MNPNLKIWRESASLILAAKAIFSQPAPSNYKILCLQRSSKTKFMPDTYVFPGGNVSKSDTSVGWLNLFENFGLVLQNDEENKLPKYLSFRICAIRETFEECGILLCRSPKINADTDSKWASFIGGHEFKKWQHKVHDNSEEFLNLCKHFDIYPDVWALKNWSNWLTPATNQTSKFNTIFFLAALHQMPTVNKDEREIQDLMWTTPNKCIELNNQQTVMLPPPQFYEMSRLRTITDVETLADFADKRSKHGFDTYWPSRIRTDEGLYTILPGDELHQIDEANTKIPHMERLPEHPAKHRIFHKTTYSNDMEVENFISNCNQIIPTKSN